MSQIPKIFYQSWDTELPYKYSSENMKYIPNDFIYKRYSLDDIKHYLNNKWGENYLNLFNSYSKIAHKVDLWRYCILYDTGGVYMDADCILKSNIDKLLDNTAVFVTNNRNVDDIFNGFIITIPRNPIIKDIINYMMHVGSSVQDDYYYNCKELYHIVNRYIPLRPLKHINNCSLGKITMLIDQPMEDGRYYPMFYGQPILVETNNGYPYRPTYPKHFIHIGNNEDDNNNNTKVILLEEWFPDNSYFVLNDHPYNDTFDITVKNSILTITRTDENKGWGHNHSGYIIPN
jgi:hypothetical protein